MTIATWTPQNPHSHRKTCTACGASTIHQTPLGSPVLCLGCATAAPAKPVNLRNLPAVHVGVPAAKHTLCTRCGSATTHQAETEPGLCMRCDQAPPVERAENLSGLPGGDTPGRHPCPRCGASTTRQAGSGSGWCLACSRKDPLGDAAGPLVEEEPEGGSELQRYVDDLMAAVNRRLGG